MLLFTALLFLALLFAGRAELGIGGVAVALLAWLGAGLAFYVAGAEAILFTIPQVALCIVLILVIFRGDIRL